ncbi:hypothetical protein QGP82_25555 [Leptothoe sp. LEGE 181152]|nr:hypothetical protein [Leptothoe sp. LEGE 181152]
MQISLPKKWFLEIRSPIHFEPNPMTNGGYYIVFFPPISLYRASTGDSKPSYDDIPF